MRFFKLWCTLLFLFSGLPAYSSQDTSFRHVPTLPAYSETSVRLMVGGHLQQAKDERDKEFTRKYLEAGFYFTGKQNGGRHPAAVLTHGISMEYAPGLVPIYGIKYGGWLCASLFVLGINGVYYTDGHRGNFKIRPESGLGFNATKLVMGINIPTIRNADFYPLKKSLLQISLCTLIKIKTIQSTRQEVKRY